MARQICVLAMDNAWKSPFQQFDIVAREVVIGELGLELVIGKGFTFTILCRSGRWVVGWFKVVVL